MQEDLVDDKLLCEDSPFNLEVDHYSTGVGEMLFQKQIPGRHDTLPAPVLTDAFHGLFAGEVALHPNADYDAEAWWREFFGSGEARTLRDKTVGKQMLAEAAAVEIARKIHDYCQRQDGTAGKEGESYDGIVQRIRSVKDAVESATEAAEDLEKIGCSLGAGLGGKVSVEEFKQLCERMKRSKTLRSILDIAGSMLEFRGGIKKKKIAGYEKIDGVMQSGDITRLLPSEIMQLAAGPLLATNMLRRMVENQTLALRKYSEQKAGRGPIVVVVDGSGSMEGPLFKTQPIHEAKALSLTMARIALEQKRWIALVEFGNSSEWKELVMPPDQWNMTELVAWLEHYFDGGTSFSVIGKVVDAWSRWKMPKGKADIIFATDCRARFDDRIVKKFNAFKKDKDVRCYGLAINSDTGDLPLICDKSWTTHSMGLESQAVREILSNNC